MLEKNKRQHTEIYTETKSIELDNESLDTLVEFFSLLISTDIDNRKNGGKNA